MTGLSRQPLPLYLSPADASSRLRLHYRLAYLRGTLGPPQTLSQAHDTLTHVCLHAGPRLEIREQRCAVCRIALVGNGVSPDRVCGCAACSRVVDVLKARGHNKSSRGPSSGSSHVAIAKWVALLLTSSSGGFRNSPWLNQPTDTLTHT